MRPEGPKKIFFRPPPPLSQGLDDCAPPYLKVWICHCCKSSRINNVIKTNLYGTVQAFLMSYGIFLGVVEQSDSEAPKYGFIKWVRKLEISYHASRLKAHFERSSFLRVNDLLVINVFSGSTAISFFLKILVTGIVFVSIYLYRRLLYLAHLNLFLLSFSKKCKQTKTKSVMLQFTV